MAQTVSIIIITYNRPNDLLDLLKSLNEQDSLDALEETLILNNASTDTYEDVAHFIEQHQRIKANIITVKENLGVAGGRNYLMQRAGGDLLLVLDDDIVFSKSTDFETFASVLNKPIFQQANTAVVTPKVIYYDNKEIQQTAFPHKDFQAYVSKHQFLTSYYVGCAHILKAEVLKKTGLYPENFFYGMEEYDLGYRIIGEGYTIGYDDEITIQHKESSQGRQPNYRKLQMQWVNKSKVAWRYLPFQYFLTTTVAWSFEYSKKAKGHLGAYFAAWFQIFAIPFSEKRSSLHKSALTYLKKTHARLWY